MHRSRTWLVLVVSALAGCASRGAAVPEPQLEVRGVAPQSASEYRAAADYAQLERLVERDLAARDVGGVKEGLEAFMRQAILEARARRAQALFAKLRPAWRLQGAGGERYVGTVLEQQRMLELEGRRELEQAHAALERGEWDELRRLRADARSVLGAETVELAPELTPHAALADALLRYEDLRAAADRDPAHAQALAASLEALGAPLERDGFGSLAFLARIAAAEALDRAALEAQAVERWLALLESPHFATAHGSVQAAIAVRLRAYTDRLREELAGRIRAEEQALAAERIRQVEARSAQVSAQQGAEIEALESELARKVADTQSEVRANLATQRALYEGTLEQLQQRVRELEGLLAKVVLDREAQPNSSVDLDAGASAVSLAADLVTIWTAARRFRSPRLAPASVQRD